MANTRDILGDQATLDGLVSRTLESFEDDGVTTLRSGAFAHNSALKRVKLPNLNDIPIGAFQRSGLTVIEADDFQNVTNLGDNAFYYCTSLTEAVFPSVVTVSSNDVFSSCHRLSRLAFMAPNFSERGIRSSVLSGCHSLRHLVINSTKKVSYYAYEKGIPFTRLEGAVYVPANLVETYRSDANWGKMIIEDVTNYPFEKFETISDSWTEIVANPNYATDYSIGDTKAVKIGEDWYSAEIIGIDKDVDENGNTIPLTWMLIDCIEKRRMNATKTTENGWEATEMRSYLNSNILTNLDIKDFITPAVKTYYDVTTDSTKSCIDSLWIPSYRELGYSGDYHYEDSGCVYDEKFVDNSSRLKYDHNSGATSVWTRTAQNATAHVNFLIINTNGQLPYSGSAANSASSAQFTLGFCTQ